MKTFNDLVFEKHPMGIGIQARIQFDNGFGASVVKGRYTYGGPQGLYEVAVLDKDGHLTYDTMVTDDVIGHLTEQDVTDVLAQIQSLTNNQ